MGSSLQLNFAQSIQGSRLSSSRDDIQVELTRLLFRKLAITVLVGGIGFGGTCALLAQHYADPILWRLTTVIAIVSIIRLATVLAFNARPRHGLTPASAALWEFVYGFITLLYCTSGAAFTLYSFRLHDATAQILCTMGVFSIGTAISSRLGMRPWLSQLCCFVMLAALALSVGASSQILTRTGLVILCLFAYTSWEGVQNKFQILVDQLRSRHTLQHLALHDPLTGLANRRHFEESLAALCAQPRTFGLLYMDLDRFKQVNDTYGHLTGDALLKQVAFRLREVVRRDDLLARLGGDEFAIIQTQIADEESPRHLAARIHDALTQAIVIEGHEIRVNASIGARISEGVPTSPRVLLGCADAALYRVKQAGGASFALAKD